MHYTIPEGLPASKVIRWNFDSIVNQLSSWSSPLMWCKS